MTYYIIYYIDFIIIIDEYRTRKKNGFKQKYTRTTKRQYCLSNIGVKVWNCLNENIISCFHYSRLWSGGSACP